MEPPQTGSSITASPSSDVSVVPVFAVVRKYRPDFLIRLASGDMLVLETKGQDTESDRVKRRYLDEWVQAVNQQGGFGRWRWDVAMRPGDILDILARHA